MDSQNAMEPTLQTAPKSVKGNSSRETHWVSDNVIRKQSLDKNSYVLVLKYTGTVAILGSNVQQFGLLLGVGVLGS